ncbi:MAG: pilus assembly protein TadG-related protein [Phycisphaerae bacterium]
MTRPHKSRRIAAGRTGPARTGQVLVITLLAMALMAGLVFFVVNVGVTVNRRRDMQDAADAAAISGSTWMARSMNLVAMNNVGQAKSLSLVPVLDAMPQATWMAATETNRWVVALSDQIDRGSPPVPERNMIESALTNLRDRMRSQVEVLSPVASALADFDMDSLTYYRTGAGGPAPQGLLWRAAQGMDELSQATVATAGIFAQADAAQFGTLSGADAALMVPIVPRIDAVRTNFGDFEYPLKGRAVVRNDSMEGPFDSGGAGGVIPDMAWPHRLGPWARLHRWRNYLREATAWEYRAGTPGYGQTRGGGGVGVGGRRNGSSARTPSGGGRPGRWHATDWRVYGYAPFGPYWWAKRRVIHDWAYGWYDWYNNRRTGHLPDTRFHTYANQLADIKLRYMFESRQPVGYHVPEWEHIRYPDARNFAQNNEDLVKSTMFYLVEIASRIKPGRAGYLSPGSYRANSDYAIAIWSNGWVDPAGWGVPMVSSYIWKDQYTYETTMDPEIGIEPELDPVTGESEWQTVYMTSYYVFGGIDTGRKRQVPNPCNWQDGDELPAPMVLTAQAGDIDPRGHVDRDEGIRRELYSFLGAVREPNEARVWPQRFGNANPAGPIVATSQAIIFNNKSWDLWTQDWQAKLVPLTGWEDWTDRLDESSIDADEVQGIILNRDIEALLEFMDSLDGGLIDAHRSQ